MKYNFKRIKSKWIVLVIIIINFIIIWKNPHFLFKDGQQYKARKNALTHFDMLTFVPQDTMAIVVYQSRAENHTKIKYLKLESNKISELYLPGISCLAIDSAALSNLYYSKINNRVYTILSDLKGNYEFSCIYDDGKKSNSSTKFYRHPLYEELTSDFVSIKNSKFYKNILSGITTISKHKDGYRFEVTSADMKEFYNFKTTGLEQNTCINKLLNASQNLGLNLEPSDIYKIIWSHRRNDFFAKSWYTKDNSNHGFMTANIVGETDCNDDGKNDFIISIVGGRFINSKLMAYDWENNKIIWEKEFSLGVNYKDIKLVDFDSDGVKEIIVSSNSPRCENAPSFYDAESIVDDTNYSCLYILNAKGEFIFSEDSTYVHAFGPGYYKTRYLYLEDKKEIIFGVRANHDSSAKKIMTLDLESGDISSTNIAYNNLVRMLKVEDEIHIFNRFETRTYDIILDNNCEIKKATELFPQYQDYKIHPKSISLLDKTWMVSNKFIYDTDHNLLTKDMDLMIYNNYYTLNNRFYYEGYGKYNRLYYLEFYRNLKINPYFIVLLLLEIILLTIWFNTKAILSIPLLSLSNNNIYMFRFFGFFYYWKITGHLVSRISLPKGITTRKEEALKLINDLSAKEVGIARKLNFFIQLKVFSVPSLDYLAVIQRLTHDLKNDLMLMKLDTKTIAHHLPESDVTLLDKNLSTISEKAQLISNFSHISHLNREPLNVNNLITSVLIGYSNNRKYDQIEFIENEEITIEADRTFLDICIKNLLNNALEAVDDKSLIFIFLEDLGDFISIEFKNETDLNESDLKSLLKIGLTNKQNGSGLGLSIAKSICQSHYGDLLIELSKGVFSATMKIPKAYNKEKI